jgi:hypothetical protein
MLYLNVAQHQVADLNGKGTHVKINGEDVVLRRVSDELIWDDQGTEIRRSILMVEERELEGTPCLTFYAD